MTLEERQAHVRTRIGDLDKLDPQVPVKLRGNNYKLEFDNAAVKAVFKQTGVNIFTGGHQTKLDDPEFLPVMLHCGLMRHHADVTLEDVDKLITARGRLVVITALRTATDLFMPDISDLPKLRPDGTLEEDKEVTDPIVRPNGIGSVTGPQLVDSDFLGTSSGDQA